MQTLRKISAPYFSTETGELDEFENQIMQQEPIEGFFAVSHLVEPELEDKLFETDAIYSKNSGAPTYLYKWDSQEEYDAQFPVIEEPVVEYVEPKPKAYDLDAGKAKAKLILKNEYNKRSIAITADYPEREVLTWPTKLEEALRFQSGEGSEYIENIASLIGTTAEAFAKKVLDNNTAYQQAIAQLEAFRMLTSRAIEAATTEREINEIMRGFI